MAAKKVKTPRAGVDPLVDGEFAKYLGRSTLYTLDEWRNKQTPPLPRKEAVDLLVRLGLMYETVRLEQAAGVDQRGEEAANSSLLT